jgi:hypothetical protein
MMQIGLTRHRADFDLIIADLDAGHSRHPVEIDEVIRRHDPHIEHRHQRLPAGEQFRVFETREQIVEIGTAPRIVVDEGRGLHGIVLASLMRTIISAPQLGANAERGNALRRRYRSATQR